MTRKQANKQVEQFVHKCATAESEPPVVGSATGYAVVGTRIKDGKEECFRTPRNPKQWYRHPVADKMLAVMTQAHPSWQWQIEIEPPNVKLCREAGQKTHEKH